MTGLPCNTCRRIYIHPIEVEHIERTGECLGCDSIRGEGLEQQKADAEEEDE